MGRATRTKAARARAEGGIIVEIRKMLGMPVKKGRLLSARGKYYLSVGRRRILFPRCPLTSKKDVARLAGKDVAVAMSGNSPAAIGPWPMPKPGPGPIRCYWLICYYPAPDMMMRKVNRQLRETLVRIMVKEKIITPKLAREVRRGMRPM